MSNSGAYKPKMLMIAYVWPEPKSSAAGVRDLALLEIFRDAGYSVTFASTAKDSEGRRELEALGFGTLTVEANDSAFDTALAELKPDVVVFGRYFYEEQFGWRVRAVCPDAITVLDTVDLHFLRKARDEWSRAGVPAEEIYTRLTAPADREDLLREIAAIHRCDLTFLCSDFEMELLTREYGVPAERLRLASFFYPGGDPAPLSFSARSGFSAVGNFRHAPNFDAARWLKQDLWPRIRRELPTAELELIGAYPPREVMGWHSPRDGFMVRGPDLGEIHLTLAKFRVNLAPLRFGAGIKGKIAEGWRVGTPAITTPIGAEGMCVGLPFGGLVGRSPEDLVAQAIALYRDETEWQRASAQGLAIVRENFSRARNAATLMEAVENLRTPAELRAHRGRAIVGLMLWQQGNRATEYFSRWIEAKNLALKTETKNLAVKESAREASALAPLRETETAASPQ